MIEDPMAIIMITSTWNKEGHRFGMYIKGYGKNGLKWYTVHSEALDSSQKDIKTQM